MIRLHDFISHLKNEVATGADLVPLYLHVSDGRSLRPAGLVFGFTNSVEAAQIIREELESGGDSCFVIKCEVIPRRTHA